MSEKKARYNLDTQKFESEYFNVHHIENPDNYKMTIESIRIKSYMTAVEATNHETFETKLRKSFLTLLSCCTTDKDLYLVSDFLLDLAIIGGRAASFYDENYSMISREGIERAKKELEEIREYEVEKEKQKSKKKK